MTINILVEPKLLPIPETAKVLLDAGEIEIVVNDDLRNTVRGNHMVLEDTEDAIKKWLGKFDGVWVGYGMPQLQQFKVMHIKD